MFDCKLCNLFSSKTNHGLSQHVRFAHKIPIADYRVKYENKTVLCIVCGEKKPHRSKYDFCDKCYYKSDTKKQTAKANVKIRRSYTGKKNPHYKGLIKIKCPCGNCFEVPPARKDIAKYCSRSCKHKFSVSITKITVYKNIRFRSRWEAVFAKWCDLHSLHWQYEPTQISVNGRWYIPDFYITEWDCFVEVKGFWRVDAKEKFDIASKTNTIKLVDKDWFIANGFQFTPKKGLFIKTPGDFI